jgi:hypothetical protein
MPCADWIRTHLCGLIFVVAFRPTPAIGVSRVLDNLCNAILIRDNANGSLITTTPNTHRWAECLKAEWIFPMLRSFPMPP